MHELGIAKSVLDAVCGEASKHAGARVVKVGLRIGELAGVDPEALQFSFQCLIKDTPLDPLPLEIEFCPRQQRCPACRHAFCVADYETSCPTCGATPTECIGGTELEFSYLELEEK